MNSLKNIDKLSSSLTLLLEECPTLTASQALLFIEIASGKTRCSDLRKIIPASAATLSRMIARLGHGDRTQPGLDLVRSFRGVDIDQRYVGVDLTPKGEVMASKLSQVWS